MIHQDIGITRKRKSDADLRIRAQKVIPGGMWGHMNAGKLPPAYPQYFSRGEGAYVWDADGNKYVDFMCAFGPTVLGHCDPDVNAAIEDRLRSGDLLTGPTNDLVELAEQVVDIVPFADWVLFTKNGTDATTLCCTIARAATGARKILVANGAYHGAIPWCSPYSEGATAEDRAHLITFEYNDIADLNRAVNAAGDDLAAIMVTPFRHDNRRDQEMPSLAFAQAARAACDRAGAALILDDVRACCRLNIGGSWEPLGVRPDLSAWGKALGNGQPISAVLGNDQIRSGASSVFTTGSFWCASAPMAAAKVTLAKLQSINFVAHLELVGQRFRDGLNQQAAKYEISLRQTGPVQMPLILFEDDADFSKGAAFASAALECGLYVHPWHNMFLSTAHSEADIDLALEATDQALASLANMCAK